jgi:hypothetical protein
MSNKIYLTNGIIAIIAASSPVAVASITAYAYKWKTRLDFDTKKHTSEAELKREYYRDFIYAIETWYERNAISDRTGVLMAEDSINRALAMIDLLSPKEIYVHASRVMEIIKLERGEDSREEYTDKLYSLMRADLGTADPAYSLRDA